MNADSARSTRSFPLDALGGVLDNAPPRGEPFDPAGSWKAAWGIYTLAGARPGRVGRLSLSRTVARDGRVALDVQHEKRLSGGSAHLNAKIELASDNRLSTPDRWRFDRHLCDGRDRVIPDTRLEKSAVWKQGKIEISDGRATRRVEMPGKFALGWALFDAVTRLPGKKTEPLAFTLVDHFDQIKPGGRLSYRETADIPMGGRTVRLDAYDQIGEGIVPWVWWVDEQARLRIAVSGLEAYVL